MDDNNLDDTPVIKTYTQEEVDALTAGLKSKNQELLGETKAEREKRKSLEDAQLESQRKADEEKGEFKSLYQRSLEEIKTLKENALARDKKERDFSLSSASALIGKELSSDVTRSELLAEQAIKFTKFGDDGSISYEIGGIAVKREELVEHLKVKFPMLADGVKSSGGGATGGDGGGAMKKFEEYSGAELKAIRESSPEQYEQLKMNRKF